MLQCVAGGLPWRRKNGEASRLQQAGQVIERRLDRRRDMLKNLGGDDEIVGTGAGGWVHDVQSRLTMEECVLIIKPLGKNFGDRSPIAQADASDLATAREVLQRKDAAKQFH